MRLPWAEPMSPFTTLFERFTIDVLKECDVEGAGRGQNYITIVSDLDRATVEYNADGRRQTSLDGYFERFTADQFGDIGAVAMHM